MNHVSGEWNELALGNLNPIYERKIWNQPRTRIILSWNFPLPSREKFKCEKWRGNDDLIDTSLQNEQI